MCNTPWKLEVTSPIAGILVLNTVPVGRVKPNTLQARLKNTRKMYCKEHDVISDQ